MITVPDLDITLLRTFVALNDTCSVTLAGRLVGRTQPAVTHQMQRLEKAMGKPLFAGARRQGNGHVALTRDGEMLLGYARTLLTLNEEIRSRFQAPEIAGTVRLGVPDLYAAFLLPKVLSGFARAYPQIEIELRCSRSVHLFAALQRDEIDLALMTRQPEFGACLTVREEPLIWVAGKERPVALEGSLPLALMPVGSIFRQHALEALGRAGRAFTIAAVSDSIAGLQAAVYAGLAISVFPLCALDAALRRVGTTEALPILPSLPIVLQRRAGPVGAAVDHLARYIQAELAVIRQ